MLHLQDNGESIIVRLICLSSFYACYFSQDAIIVALEDSVIVG